MSGNRRCRGLIGALIHPMDDEQREETQERFFTEGKGYNINYAGDLFYIDEAEGKDRDDELYFVKLGVPSRQDVDKFITLAAEAGCPVEKYTVLPFDCIYYGGCDNPVDEFDIETFRAAVKTSYGKE